MIEILLFALGLGTLIMAYTIYAAVEPFDNLIYKILAIVFGISLCGLVVYCTYNESPCRDWELGEWLWFLNKWQYVVFPAIFILGLFTSFLVSLGKKKDLEIIGDIEQIIEEEGVTRDEIDQRIKDHGLRMKNSDKKLFYNPGSRLSVNISSIFWQTLTWATIILDLTFFYIVHCTCID